MESFEFKGIITKENAKDYFASTKIVKRIKNSSLFISPILALLTVIFSFAHTQTGNFFSAIISYALLSAFVLGYGMHMPTMLTKSYFKNQRSLYNCDSFEITAVFSDNIFLSTKVGTNTIEYAQIKQIVDNKSVIALLAGNTGIIVPKANLVDADINDFIAFMETKTNLKCVKNKKTSTVLLIISIILCCLISGLLYNVLQ